MTVFNLAVTVRKVDNIVMHISTEDFDFEMLMRDKFSFFADGYKFHPAFKSKYWDGKIYLLNVDGTMPIGLISEVVAFCERQNRTIFVDPSIRTNQLDKVRLNGFIDSLDVYAGGDKIDPYYYQKDAVHFALEQKRSILLSPTSSGKSLIQYILLRVYQQMTPGEKMLIIVPSIGLVTQMRGDFDDYASNIDWSVDEFITGIAKGKEVDDEKNIIISTFQSLSNPKTKPDPSYFHQFKYVMVDECHTAKAKSIKYILDNSINAEYRVGLTGTLDGCKTNEMVLRGMFGNICNVIETRELMDQGKVANLNVNCILMKYPEETCKFLRSAPRGGSDDGGKQIRRKADYVEEINYITTSEVRNLYIMRLVASLPGNSILMINQIDHGENLFKWMKKVLPDRDIFLYNGSTDKDERERIRKLMEETENGIIIGSLGVLSTGISIKRLNNLVFAHPTKSRIKTLQSVGRLLRISKFGNEVKMYDIIDDFSIGGYVNYTLEHGRQRVQYYMDQRFVCNTTIVNL